jgi:hypothetical protein
MILNEFSEALLFRLLVILDGASAFSDGPEHDRLEVYFKTKDKTVLLNNPSDIALHDLMYAARAESRH